MPVDRKQLSNSFTENDIPEYFCPTCETGVLELFPDTFKYKWPKYNKVDYDQHGFEEYIEFRYIAFLKCSNKACGEIVTITGNGSPLELLHSDPFGPGESSHETFYKPIFFNPPLHFFKINQFELPEEVETALKEAFSIYWFDINACASKLRTTIERVLDSLDIERYDSKENRINLHSRINIFKAKDINNIHEYFESIKWLGNEGTHETNVDKEELLSTFDMIEHIFEHIYLPPKDTSLMDTHKRQIIDRYK